ncbi:MAG TPA: PadR family transcriptional regulator [Candidatus Limnocylindria bacterium]|jgi:DNA-binding PadR family transcriptional regulator|nr:PadR family transcriptional regulator [Candidatus Limnocylindria bacterium]
MQLRYALLALLGEGEAHGYELLKRFNRRIGPFWHPNIGQVYQLLHDLERRGLVVRRDQGESSRGRRVFRLTPRGERALATWLTRRPAWPAPLREEIFVRLLAAEREGPDAVLAQLERQEIEYHHYLALVRGEAARPDAPVTRRLAHEAALGQAETHLRWLARCREATRDLVSGRNGQRECRPVDSANGVPRPAKAGAADLPEDEHVAVRRPVRA